MITRSLKSLLSRMLIGELQEQVNVKKLYEKQSQKEKAISARLVFYLGSRCLMTGILQTNAHVM